MHDVKHIVDFPEEFDNGLKQRGMPALSSKIAELYQIKKDRTLKLQKKQEDRNLLAKKIGEMKASKQDSSSEEKQAVELKKEIQLLSEECDKAELELKIRLESIPNTLSKDVLYGKSDADNVELKKIGTKPEMSFTPKTHYELGEALGWMDFETATKISGSRFVILKGPLARMERALAAFMIDSHMEFGHQEYSVPFLVNTCALYGTAQLPKFQEDLFHTTDDRWLIPTSEVSLTNTVRDSILDVAKLPIRLTAYTPCFRSEAGAAGRDTVGMIRQHQFSKVELVSITKQEDSWAEHERILSVAENILRKLNIHYRVVTLCSGDTGFSSAKTYDIEVWMPGLGQYREISSCSNCLDFQARRMNARYKDNEGNNKFVHTLNGSGLAVGRTIAAIMENYQREDGSIKVPDALVKYMGIEEIHNAKITS